MRFMKCDACGKETHEHTVTLKGVSGGYGIALPEQFHERHFCDANCLASWVLQHYAPNGYVKFEMKDV